MIKRPAKNDDDPDSPDLSQLFCSLVLEIDDAVSQGASADLHKASLAGLSSEEADRLREAPLPGTALQFTPGKSTR